MIFKKIAIIGAGLIGGSIGLAVKERRLAKSVIGIGRRSVSIKEALRRGAIDFGTKDLPKGVSGADLVVIATPVGLIPKIAAEIFGALKKGVVVTDVGSTKSSVVKEIEDLLPREILFVGSHPLAGSEKKGALSAESDLFEGSVVVMTKTDRTNNLALRRLSGFWKSLGAARVVIKSPEEHDKIVAEISHLPHIVTTALINSANAEYLDFASTGFKDTTRIAASDPGIWKDICITNGGQIIKAINRYERYLSRLKKLIVDGKWESLKREFAKSKDIREKLR
ncbi:MAG: prephenate dehydrogenase [Candidatus Omnitrophota bacterium]